MMEAPDILLLTVTQQREGGRRMTASKTLYNDHRYTNGSFLRYVANHLDWTLYQETGFVSPDRVWQCIPLSTGDPSRLLDGE